MECVIVRIHCSKIYFGMTLRQTRDQIIFCAQIKISFQICPSFISAKEYDILENLFLEYFSNVFLIKSHYFFQPKLEHIRDVFHIKSKV